MTTARQKKFNKRTVLSNLLETPKKLVKKAKKKTKAKKTTKKKVAKKTK
jgi:hypothetical protein